MSWTPPFTVMVTIHGPKGWFDVVNAEGETVAVCPKKRFAKEIAAVMNEQAASRIDVAGAA
jgi:hypothetical protein